MSRKSLLILLAALVLIVAGGGAYFYFAPGTGAADAGYTILPTDRTQGNPKSKVVLIEYAAPVCPHCAAFNADIFPRLKQAYIDNGKIYYVFRVFPISPDDGAAEKMARCLPEDKYFSFIDLLFRNQALWDPEFVSPDAVHAGLVRMGRMAGMSADQVDKCIDNKAEDDRINKVTAEAQSRYNVQGTPTFIVNGNNIGSGDLPFDQIAKSLDTELAKK